jgi:hypothetical protein
VRQAVNVAGWDQPVPVAAIVGEMFGVPCSRGPGATFVRMTVCHWTELPEDGGEAMARHLEANGYRLPGDCEVREVGGGSASDEEDEDQDETVSLEGQDSPPPPTVKRGPGRPRKVVSE